MELIENGQIEIGVMANEETGERLVGLNIPGTATMLLTPEQARLVAEGMIASAADVEAKPFNEVAATEH